MRAIDTTVLVRLLIQQPKEMAREAEAFVRGGAWVSLVVLTETVWVLLSIYQLPRANLVNSLDLLLGHPDIVLENTQAVESALSRFERHPGLGFSDCLILEVARSAGHLPLGTFDRDLAKKGSPDAIRIKG